CRCAINLTAGTNSPLLCTDLKIYSPLNHGVNRMSDFHHGTQVREAAMRGEIPGLKKASW
ncbi:uS14 family ribosomal protein, partial [Salmonella enterica subsp. enterica serovar Montevideo]|nr:uS14 family ribosomal protein [Salmonella enterica subsp. enterica serovar Montevideo]